MLSYLSPIAAQIARATSFLSFLSSHFRNEGNKFKMMPQGTGRGGRTPLLVSVSKAPFSAWITGFLLRNPLLDLIRSLATRFLVNVLFFLRERKIVSDQAVIYVKYVVTNMP